MSGKGARSYSSEILEGDTLSFRVNLRFLFNTFLLLSTIIGSAYHVKSQIDDAIRRLLNIEIRVLDLESKHDAEIKAMEEAWLKKSVKSIFGKDKRK